MYKVQWTLVCLISAGEVQIPLWVVVRDTDLPHPPQTKDFSCNNSQIFVDILSNDSQAKLDKFQKALPIVNILSLKISIILKTSN